MKDPFQLKRNLILITYTVVLVAIVLHLKHVFMFLGFIMRLFTPLFVGLALAFLLNLMMRRIEKALINCLPGTSRKGIRAVSVLCTFLLFTIFIALLFAMLLPELGRSARLLAVRMPEYFREISAWILAAMEGLNIHFSADDIKALPWQEGLQKATELAQDFFLKFFTSAGSVTSAMANAVMGVIISIYMLMNKETLLSQMNRVIHAFLSPVWAERLERVGRLSNRVLTSFVSGQVTEAFILGVLCFIGMTFFRMEYAPLIAAVIGVTNLIPFFGPILGTIPCAFLLLMTNPVSALLFVVFILVLQQIDSNLIYPRVVGDSVHLPAMWIMLSILVGGGLFGVLGMILGVPVFAVFYTVAGEYVNKRYQARKEKGKGK